MALRNQHGDRVDCQMCGAITGVLYRRKAGPLRQGYDGVCRNCLDYHFSPTTIVNNTALADARYEWTPAVSIIDRIIRDIKLERAAG